MQIKIGNKIIKEGNPCFIIAEAGVNHNGSFRLAKKMVEAAKRAGADAIKFQTFKTEELVTGRAATAEYQKRNLGKDISQGEMLKRLELKEKDFINLKKYCDKKGIIFLSTAHTETAVDQLRSLVPVYKVASADLTNIPLLIKMAKTGKPILLSTGMGTINEIRLAVKEIKRQGNQQIIIIHCTANYPCPFNEVNLNALATLRRQFKTTVGYSDHTPGLIVPVMAVALGAKVIEKHFTLDRNLAGPDHQASLEPDELKEMVGAVRNAEKALGSFTKKPTASEQMIKKVARKSIVAKIDIPKGQKISAAMLIIKRPATGIAPLYFKKIIGLSAKNNIKKDSLIKWESLEKKRS